MGDYGSLENLNDYHTKFYQHYMNVKHLQISNDKQYVLDSYENNYFRTNFNKKMVHFLMDSLRKKQS